MKKFLFVLLMVVVVAVAFVFVFLQKLDGFVQNKIEVIGTETLGQAVHVGGVNIELKNGMGEITNLLIANPQGFVDAEAFKMARIRLGIDVTTLSKNPLVLNEFIIESPVVSLEMREDGSSNLDEIIAHLQDQQKQTDPKPKATPDADEPVPAEDLLLVIKELKIAGVQLTLRHPKFGEAPKEFILPDIDLYDVGGDEGVNAATLSELVVVAIAKEGAKKALMDEANKQANKLLNKAASSLKKKLSNQEAASE